MKNTNPNPLVYPKWGDAVSLYKRGADYNRDYHKKEFR